MIRRAGTGSFFSSALVLLWSTGCTTSSSGTATNAPAVPPASSAAPSLAPEAAAGDAATGAEASLAAPAISAPPPLAPARCAAGCQSAAAAYATLLPGTRAHPCMEPSRTFPDVLPVGRYNADLGCVPQGVIYSCCLHTPTEVSTQKLAAWPSLPPETRQSQALAWTREIIFPFQTILDVAPKEFTARNHTFSAPVAAPLPNGGVVVTVWLRERAGPTKGTVFTAQQVRFSPVGVVERMAQVAQWVH